ncbi:MAG: pseudouridine synthase [Cognatishimia sp.]
MTQDTPKGDRIAKVLARAGVASRRDAERMIEAGRVSVDGKTLSSPALNVTSNSRILVDGKPIAEKEPERIWLYHKPSGLVTSHKDEKDRKTIFDELPEDLPRVMTIGRLDLNSEGLLLLTNDGGVKRKLELPSTGWVRRYRVRVNGRPTDAQFDPLRKGITVDGEDFAPMTITLDSQKGANAWVTVSLREGKNREIRRAMSAIELTVNRLIRIAYGPFQLGDLKPGAVEELRRKVVRDQLGLDGAIPPEDRKKPTRRKKPTGDPKSGGKPAQTKHATEIPAFGKTFTSKPGAGKSSKNKPREKLPESPWDDYGNPIPKGRGKRAGGKSGKPNPSGSGRKPPYKG